MNVKSDVSHGYNKGLTRVKRGIIVNGFDKFFFLKIIVNIQSQRLPNVHSHLARMLTLTP